MSETDKLLYRSDWELKKSLKGKGSPVPKCTDHIGPTRANRTMPCPSLTTALGSRGTWRNACTSPLGQSRGGTQDQTWTQTFSEKEASILSVLAVQRFKKSTRLPEQTSQFSLRTARQLIYQSWRTDMCELQRVLSPPPHLSLRATAALREQRISPKTYYTVITHKQTWKFFSPNGPDLQSTGTSQLLLMKCSGGAMKSHGILEYTDIPTCQGRGTI